MYSIGLTASICVLGTTSRSQSVFQYVSISASTNHLSAVTYSAKHSILASTMVLQSISVSTGHLSVVIPSLRQSVSASTMEFPVVSKSENRGVSISGSESSSFSPSEGRSISASLFPNAMLILNTFLLENLLRMLLSQRSPY